MWATRTSSGAAPIGPRRRHKAGDRVACRRAYTLERARCHTRQTRCTPYARRVEIDWAPLIASTSAGPKGRRPPAGPPARTVTRSPSAARRSWPAADDGRRPEHPVRGSLGPPAPQPETEPASATPRAAVIPTARDTDSRSSPRNRRITTSRLRPAENRPPTAAPGGHAGHHRFLNVLPHRDTPPARTLSQSSVQENPSRVLKNSGWQLVLW